MTCTGEEVLIHTRYFKMGAKENSEERENRSSDIEKDVKQENGESDYEPARDSLSSQSNEDNKIKRTSRVPKKPSRKESTENFTRPTRCSSNRLDSSKLQCKTPNNSQKRSQKSSSASSAPKVLSNGKSPDDVKGPSKPPSELSEESDDKASEEVKEIDALDEAPICDQSMGTDDETADAEENTVEDDGVNAYQKIDEMKQRIEKLEEELKEVAALEISLYSIVPEHGSSAHKVHTPARRLSRLYIHSCKHWIQDKRATVAKNTVSGLVLIAKSCGNDVSRLTFWLSNTVVLREIISQTSGNLSHQNSVARSIQLNGSGNKSEGTSSPAKWKNNSGGRQMKKSSFTQQIDDWQETSTFVAALEKIEAWIFSRAVESVWWQTLTPHMQSPLEDLYSERRLGKLLGTALGDQQQGNFSINLWNSAFHDAFSRLCPVRSGGHECGCLPILARMVMKQCVSRLDVAMFNAILRESANEMPTDPVSDPIVDPKVLPIPAGDLSFGSGAQLKNSIGNWSRSLTDLFGMDSEDCVKDEKTAKGDVEIRGGDVEIRGGEAGSKSFGLLNELSDLLMLPKDMLIERDVRKEVCPSIGLPLITRILCNFTPDEFCPDHVPGIVLEELNTESLLGLRRSGKDAIGSFPFSASPVVYLPPSPADVAEKASDASGKASLDRRASIIQRKGYTSDEDLDDLDSPLTSIINKTSSRHMPAGDGTLKDGTYANARYKLLREVWSE